MLHQTQVPRVTEVYEEFLSRFPSIQDVARAPLRDVKRITDPLGYKVRGRWIKQIADNAVATYDGQLPQTVAELMTLPGVGRYTAGAVMTFAHGHPAPILDTNIARVLRRWFAGVLPADDPPATRQHRLWALADALLPRGPTAADRGWTINQALMDFGAQICTARAPACDTCPLRRRCHTIAPRIRAAERLIVEWEEDSEKKTARNGSRNGSAASVRYPAPTKRTTGPSAKRSGGKSMSSRR